MPDFNVGDRVRCIRTHDWGTEGQLGTVTREGSVHNSPQVRWDDSAVSLWIGVVYLELVEPEPVDTQTLVRYAVVMQYPDADHPAVNFFTTQGSAERLARMVPEGGGIVLATKKIKIVVPVVVFPEMELDEDDFEIEHNEPEEDDGNAF